MILMSKKKKKKESAHNKHVKDRTIVQSKKIAYAIHGGVIMDRKGGFPMVKE